MIGKNQVHCILICFLLLNSFTTEFSSTRAGYLNSEDIIDLVLNDEEIRNWSQGYDKTTVEDVYYYSHRLIWEVRILASNGSGHFWAIVVVSSETNRIVSRTYHEAEYDEWRSSYEVIDQVSSQALQYFVSHPDVEEFKNNGFSFTSSYHHGNMIGIHGYNTSRWLGKQIWAYVGINQSVSANVTFDLIKITTNFEFGDFNLSIEDALANALSDERVQNFMKNFPNYIVEKEYIRYYNNSHEITPIGNAFHFTYQFDDEVLIQYSDNVHFVMHGGGYSGFPNGSQIGVPTSKLEIVLLENTSEIVSYTGFHYSPLEIKEILDIVFLDPIYHYLTNKSWGFGGNLESFNQNLMILTIGGITNVDYGRFVIDVQNKTVIEDEIRISKPAVSGKDQILEIVNSNTEVQDFFKLNEIVNHTLLYNYNHSWVVDLYNPLIDQNNARIIVNDTSQEIIDVDINYLDALPILRIQDVIDSFLMSGFIIHYATFLDSKLVFYYRTQGYWSAYAYSALYPENYYRCLIDDETGEVLSEVEYNFGMGNQTSFAQAKAVFNEIGELKMFRKNNPERYEYLFFKDQWTLYTDSLSSDLVADELMIKLDEDLELFTLDRYKSHLGSEFIVADEYHYYFWGGGIDDDYLEYTKIRNSKISDLIQFHGHHRLGKLYSFDLSNFVEEYTGRSYNENRNNEGSRYDLIFLGILVIAIVSAYFGRRRLKKK